MTISESEKLTDQWYELKNINSLFGIRSNFTNGKSKNKRQDFNV